jgi:hypothetical protein
MIALRQFIDFYILGRHRLEAIQLLPLGSSMSQAVGLYGQPFESKPSNETPEIMVHSFHVGRYHEAVVMEWQDSIRSITYWSAKSDPSRDLRCMLETYKGDSRWVLLEEGYWYQHEDGKMKLWCSAVPAIGVAYVDFLSAKAELKKESDIKKLDDLKDPTWVSDDAIEDLQRRFVTGQDTKLMDFARRSNRIAVSGDGQEVFIVRNHHAYDIEDEFMVLNCPPEPNEGFPVQVIHVLTWTEEDGLISRSTAIPKDANIESMHLAGEEYHLQIQRTTTGQLISLSGPTSTMHNLEIGPLVTRLNNDKLWAILKAIEAQQRGSGGGN